MHGTGLKSAIPLVVAFAIMFSCSAASAGDNPLQSIFVNKNNPHYVSARQIIYAPRATVFESIKKNRKEDPALVFSRVLEKQGNVRKLQERRSMPFIGHADYVLWVKLVPNQEIDYRLVQSGDFKEYNGLWKLTDGQTPNSTNVELKHRMRLTTPVPDVVLSQLVQEHVKRKVMDVKRNAEQSYNKTLR